MLPGVASQVLEMTGTFPGDAAGTRDALAPPREVSGAGRWGGLGQDGRVGRGWAGLRQYGVGKSSGQWGKGKALRGGAAGGRLLPDSFWSGARLIPPGGSGGFDSRRLHAEQPGNERPESRGVERVVGLEEPGPGEGVKGLVCARQSLGEEEAM